MRQLGGNDMLIFLAVLILFGAALELYSLKDNSSHIRYHSQPSQYGCEPGEAFQIKTTITNYGVRTIPFLKLEEKFPKEIRLQGVEPLSTNDDHCLHANVIYIKGRQKITRTLQASLPQRGMYRFEGCRLLVGDFLGIKENNKELKQEEEMVIFPRLLDDDKLERALSGYYGDISVRRFYIEDPILVNSYNDYTGREPMRSISWTQSAKKNRLMVKEFDHTTDLSVTILLDVYLHWSEGAHREELEYCFSLARTIAEFLEKKRASYRLLTNAYIRSRNTDYEDLGKAGQGAHHYTMLIYTLGQAASNSFCNIDGLHDIALRKYAGESALFYIAPFENEKRRAMVQSLQNRLNCQIYPMYAASMREVE